MYLDEKVIPNLGSAVNLEPRSVVIMDNAPIHQDPRIRERIHAAGAILIYTAPYSPDLNPIEPTFHQYKSYLRRHIRTGASEGQLHLDALMCITPQNMLNYYRAIGCIDNLPAENSDESIDMLCVAVVVVYVVLRSRKRRRLQLA